jgi:ATP-binding cassette subfamily B protein
MNMNNEQTKTFINHHLGQKERLPREVKGLILQELGDEPISLYALVDLDDQLNFCERWVVLTTNHLVLAEFQHGAYRLNTSFKLGRIIDLKEINSLSCTSFVLLEGHDQAPLMTLRFTHRQKIIMGHLKYLLEVRMKKEEAQLESMIDPDEEYQKAVMKPVLDAQNAINSENAQTLWRLLGYLLPYKRELMIGMSGAVAATLVSLLPAYLSGRLIDQVVKPFQDGKLDAGEASSIAWILVGALVSSYFLRELFIWVRLNKMSILGEKVAHDLRKDLYEHLQTLGLDFYSRKQTGSIISRVSSDTDRIWDFVAFGVVEVSIAVITLLSLSTVLIALDWKLGLIMAAPVPLLLYGIYRHGETMKKMFLKAWRKWSDVTAVLSDTIPGIQVVKAFNQESREIKRFNKRNGTVTEEFNNIHQAWTRFWPALMVGIHAITMTVWMVAVPRLISGESDIAHLSAGTFVSFLLYMTMFAQPIEIIGQVARMLNRALSSAYRIFEILDTSPTIVQKKNPVKLERVEGDVEFKKRHL